MESQSTCEPVRDFISHKGEQNMLKNMRICYNISILSLEQLKLSLSPVSIFLSSYHDFFTVRF